MLELQRVVILAEAGSGKTTEMQERARKLRRADRYAFYLTVKDLGKYGLEDSLEGRRLQDFVAWRASDNTAWFFVDSVDEGKLNDIGVRLKLPRDFPG